MATCYYPWGQQWKYDNEINSWWQFYGNISRFQVDLGLYLTSHRFYSPDFARWLSPDPLGGNVMNPQSFNRYAYALNNPATFNDPLGLDANCPSQPSPTHNCHIYVHATVTPLEFYKNLSNYEWYCDLWGRCSLYGSSFGSRPGGGGGVSAAAAPAGRPPQSQAKTCTASSRVLQGNPATVGAPLGHGAFNNRPNPIAPQAGSAAMTPSEFGGFTNAQLKPYALRISGYFPGTGVSFQGVTDVNGAGHTPLGFSNIRQYLEFINPGQIIIELITGPDLGSNVPVVITQPAGLPCPTAPPFVADPVTGPTVG